jgi:hypothetical protein
MSMSGQYCVHLQEETPTNFDRFANVSRCGNSKRNPWT